MSEYYDREKFTGGQKPPQRPPQKKPDNSGWYSWPAIIVLFAIGLWPVALFLMLSNIFGSGAKTTAAGQKKQSGETRATAAQEAMEKRRGAAAGAPYTTVGERVAEAEKRAQEAIDRAMAKAAKSSKTAAPKPEKQKKQKLPGKLLRVLGICLLAVGMIVSLDSAADIFQYGSYWYLEDLMAGLGFMVAGGIMWGRGKYLAHMTRRSQRYILAIGNVDVMSLAEIAKRVNRTPEKAAKELQKLIDKGYLGEDAYIDHQRGYFLRFGATLEEDKPKAEEPAAAPQEAESGYESTLRNIRRANDRIADEELSRKIDRLEQISRLIFREVEEHPEKRGRIRSFFDYYLPTTQKLLDAYADFEEAGVEGEHLRQAKERIEQTMDAIVEGFEHQLDQLYSSDAMDVVSDIKVMETMLGRDIASAAKDFGYDQAKDKDDEGGIQLEL